MPALGPHYHVGIVVPDLEEARHRFTEAFGVRWGPVLRLDAAEYRDGEGNDIELPTAMCYSVDAPHLELIEEVAGSIWTCNPHSNLHHLGFWSDDVATDSAALGAVGCPLQLCGRAGDAAPVTFAYHADPLGVRFEVIDAAMREAMAFLFQPAD